MPTTRATSSMPSALTVRLHGKAIGVITGLGGEQNLFAFEDDYIEDPERPTLSLSFKGASGGIVTQAP